MPRSHQSNGAYWVDSKRCLKNTFLPFLPPVENHAHTKTQNFSHTRCIEIGGSVYILIIYVEPWTLPTFYIPH